MKKFIVLSIILLMLAGFAITSSAQEPMVVDLLAGQTIKVGTLTVKVDGTDLVVTYSITEPGWELGETHLYVGTSVPAKSAPGQFPYGPEEVVANEVEYVIPFADFGELPVCIAAQAEVRKQTGVDPDTGELIYQEETAWAEGVLIRPGKNWAMYFTFPLSE